MTTQEYMLKEPGESGAMDSRRIGNGYTPKDSMEENMSTPERVAKKESDVFESTGKSLKGLKTTVVSIEEKCCESPKIEKTTGGGAISPIFSCENCGTVVKEKGCLEERFDAIYNKWKIQPGGTSFQEIDSLVDRLKACSHSALYFALKEEREHILAAVRKMTIKENSLEFGTTRREGYNQAISEITARLEADKDN